ncbi:hypothetical protein JOC34_000492 [Virgibacillus halotolerans]|uniref:hypothetical protein n=1 Tax=Virgibacillus halotolerans TaxID=1071053 RepID=UPI0019605D72|nr:hypothetical protein [Virgibacillus halotolerans]MBM7598135.1 hypothetical protein [Virgibacillus halotolerans]
MNINYNGLSDNEQEVIAATIKNGFMHGMIENLHWKIGFETHDWDSQDDNLQHIAHLIKEHDCTSGVYPSWKLKFERV